MFLSIQLHMVQDFRSQHLHDCIAYKNLPWISSKYILLFAHAEMGPLTIQQIQVKQILFLEIYNLETSLTPRLWFG